MDYDSNIYNMKISGIYKIQSIVKPERIYIGSAVNINRRWRNHLTRLKNGTHCNQKIFNHVNKYGITDLSFSILLFCEINDLIKTEQFFIDSYNPYFNICKVAGSPLGRKQSKETKLRLSKIHKGKKLSPEHIEKLRNKIISEETRANMRIAYQRRDNKKPHLGHKHSETTIMQMCKSHKGCIPWNKGKKISPASEETRKKMSESGKKAWVKRKLKIV